MYKTNASYQSPFNTNKCSMPNRLRKTDTARQVVTVSRPMLLFSSLAYILHFLPFLPLVPHSDKHPSKSQSYILLCVSLAGKGYVLLDTI